MTPPAAGAAPRRPGPARAQSPAAGQPDGRPAMITVTVWHNVAIDGQGLHTRDAERLPGQ